MNSRGLMKKRQTPPYGYRVGWARRSGFEKESSMMVRSYNIIKSEFALILFWPGKREQDKSEPPLCGAKQSCPGNAKDFSNLRVRSESDYGGRFRVRKDGCLLRGQ